VRIRASPSTLQYDDAGGVAFRTRKRTPSPTDLLAETEAIVEDLTRSHGRRNALEMTAAVIYEERRHGHFKMQCRGADRPPFCNHGSDGRRDFTRDQALTRGGIADA